MQPSPQNSLPVRQLRTDFASMLASRFSAVSARPYGIKHFSILFEKSSDEGSRWLRTMAARQDNFAMEKLGTWLLVTASSQENRQEGVSWLNEAIRSGSLSAMYSLASIILDSQDRTDGERDRAHRLLRESSAKGYLAAASDLGIRLLFAEGIQSDSKNGTLILRSAAERGDRLAMIMLGRSHGTNPSSTITPREAQEWMIRAGSQRSADDPKLGLYLYYRALITPGNRVRRRLVENAALLLAQGNLPFDAEISASLAYLIRRNEVGTLQFPPLEQLLANGVDVGHPFAIVNRALQLAMGISCNSDWRAADELISGLNGSHGVLEWWLQLCRENDPEGHLVIGWLVRHRLITDPNSLSLAERISLAENPAWKTPDWMQEYGK